MTAATNLARFLDAEPRAYGRAELVERFSRHSLDRALATGMVVRTAQGVYLAAGWADNLRARISAAVKSLGVV